MLASRIANSLASIDLIRRGNSEAPAKPHLFPGEAPARPPVKPPARGGCPLTGPAYGGGMGTSGAGFEELSSETGDNTVVSGA